MRPDDDRKLGKLLKDAGYKQDFVIGAALLSVEWYDSFGQMVQGLMKSMFAGVEYNAVLAIAGSAVQILMGVWPFAALVLTRGWVQILNALIVAAILLLYSANAGSVGVRRIYALAYPLAILAFCYILLRSMTVTLWTGGINWRGTHYPLSQLRAKPPMLGRLLVRGLGVKISCRIALDQSGFLTGVVTVPDKSALLRIADSVHHPGAFLVF